MDKEFDFKATHGKLVSSRTADGGVNNNYPV